MVGFVWCSFEDLQASLGCLGGVRKLLSDRSTLLLTVRVWEAQRVPKVIMSREARTSLILFSCRGSFMTCPVWAYPDTWQQKSWGILVVTWGNRVGKGWLPGEFFFLGGGGEVTWCVIRVDRLSVDSRQSVDSIPCPFFLARLSQVTALLTSTSGLAEEENSEGRWEREASKGLI